MFYFGGVSVEKKLTERESILNKGLFYLDFPYNQHGHKSASKPSFLVTVRLKNFDTKDLQVCTLIHALRDEHQFHEELVWKDDLNRFIISSDEFKMTCIYTPVLKQEDLDSLSTIEVVNQLEEYLNKELSQKIRENTTNSISTKMICDSLNAIKLPNL